MIRVTLTLNNTDGQLDEVSTTVYGFDYAPLVDVMRKCGIDWALADGDTITVQVEPI